MNPPVLPREQRSLAVVAGLLFLLALVAVLAMSCGSEGGSGGRGAGPGDGETADSTILPPAGTDTAPAVQAPPGGPGAAAVPAEAGDPPADPRPADPTPPAAQPPAPAPDPADNLAVRIPALTPRTAEPSHPILRPGVAALGPDVLPGPGVPGIQPIPAQPQEILLDLRFGRLTATTVQAFSVNNEALLPAFAFMELAEIDVRVDSLGAVRATLYPRGTPLVISADSALARAGERTVELPEAAFIRRGDETFVSTRVLEELLDVTIRTDWVALTTTVLDPENLPLAQRLAREARWDRVRTGRPAGGLGPSMELDNSAVGGAILDWGLSNGVRSPDETLAYSLALGVRVLDGSLRLSNRSLGPLSLGQDRFDATYEKVFDDLSWIRQLRVGDGLSTGPRLRNFRGVSLTNAPFIRGSFYSSDDFRGQAGPGWDVELRQSGRVVDLTRADEQGAFALDIPLRYGENAIQVVAFGPHGEVITTDRLLLAGTDLIPGGTFEWGLSAGSCRDQDCQGTGNVDLRYGVSNRLTLRGGTEAFTRETGGTLVQPYLQASGLLLPGLQLSAEGVRSGFLRGSTTYAPSPHLRIRGAYTAFSSDLADPILHDARRRATTEADVFFRPDADRPRLFLRGSLLNQELDRGGLSRVQASAAVPVGDLIVESGLRREIDDPTGPVRTGNDFQFTSVYGNVRVAGRHRLWLRGEVEVREAELMNRLRAQVGYQITNRLRVDVAAGWQKFFGSSLTVTFNALLSELRSVVQVTGAEGAATEMTQFSQGTVYWNEATRQVNFAPGPGVQRGGISGYVFLDANGNGVRDAGEEGLEGVRLVVGGRPVTTDAQGRHVSWDLVPYQEVEIWADSTSIADPTLVPEQSRVRVDVPPSSFGRVDVPVTPSREIAGSVIRVGTEPDQAPLPVPYAEMELVNTETGESREFRAFSDGQFYEAAVRPGTYELRLARDYMERASLRPEGDWPLLEVTPGSAFEILGPFQLQVIRIGPNDVQDGWVEAGQGSGSDWVEAGAGAGGEWVEAGAGGGSDGVESGSGPGSEIGAGEAGASDSDAPRQADRDAGTDSDSRTDSAGPSPSPAPGSPDGATQSASEAPAGPP